MIFKDAEPVKEYTMFLDNSIRAFVDGCLTSLQHEKVLLYIKNKITVNQYQRQMNPKEKYLLVTDWETGKETLYRVNK